MALWDRTLAVDAGDARRTLGSRPRDAVRTRHHATSVRRRWYGMPRSGVPVYPAIGWQDLRTVERCDELSRTGHTLSPMQSATKFAWVLENVPGANASAPTPAVCGSGRSTPGSGGGCRAAAAYVTDYSNASCTGLYDFFSHRWDEALFETLGLPAGVLSRRSNRPAPSPARRPPICSAPRFRSRRAPAISRRRCSASCAPSPA